MSFAPNTASDSSGGPVPRHELTALRHEIDKIDEDIVTLLGQRFRVTAQVGQLKARASMPATDAAREAEQAQRYQRLAIEAGVDAALVGSIFRTIVDEVVRNHREASQE